MLFNSISFLFFFPITTLVYFLLPHRVRWIHLLVCSCMFYAAFIPAYLLILFAVVLIDYTAGLLIERSAGGTRKAFLIISLIANIGVLSIFKYFDFCNDNLRALAEFLRWNYPVHHLGMLLPIGLSFHTFQSMAYTIEVYRGRQPAERHLGIYSLYVLFYPQLVAGPIERPQNLLHQFRERHDFDPDRIFDGLKQMLWGFFKKLVVADRLSAIVDAIYANPTRVGGAYLILATWFFAWQIYCDFSGYTDIAIGAAHVLGVRLMTNFDRPYNSTSVAEFWRRWHISLSTWFRDFLYIPLGGSRVGLPRWCFNIMLVFLISGIWHGANWTFIVWGALHGLYLIAARLTVGSRAGIVRFLRLTRFPVVCDILQQAITFNLVSLAWVFFRARSLAHAGVILQHMVGPQFFMHPVLNAGDTGIPAFTNFDLKFGVSLILFLAVSEWIQSRIGSVDALRSNPVWIRWSAHYVLILLILCMGALGARTFIYFQF